MNVVRLVELVGGPPWGFRIQGGREFGKPLVVATVNATSKAQQAGLRQGDRIVGLNGQPTSSLSRQDVLDELDHCGDRVVLHLHQGECAEVNNNDMQQTSFFQADSRVHSSETKSSSVQWCPRPGNHSLPFATDAVSPDTLRVTLAASPRVVARRVAAGHASQSRRANGTEPRATYFRSPTQANDSSAAPSNAPVWAPSGVPAPKAEYRSVRLDASDSAMRNDFARSQSLDSASYDAPPRARPPPPPPPPPNMPGPQRVAFQHALPRSQNPTVTLLQSNRDGDGPRATLLGQRQRRDDDALVTDSYYVLPVERSPTVRRAEKTAPPQYDGIGPLDDKGTPLALRTGVKDEHQRSWYKQMYKQMHKADERKEVNPYTPTYKFPEGGTRELDLDPLEDSVLKQLDSFEERFTSRDHSSVTSGTTTPGRGYGAVDAPPSRSRPKLPAMSIPDARCRIEKYRNQPNAIEDYEPGFSSIALKDTRRVSSMLYNPPPDKPGERSQYILSDREFSPSRDAFRGSELFSPDEQRDMYVQVQRGGDIPPTGLRKTVPERPPGASRRSTGSSPASSVSPAGTFERKREAERFYDEDKRRKQLEERLQVESRRHLDMFLARDKSPIPERLFDDVTANERRSLSPRSRLLSSTAALSKALALYDFKASGTQELSFKTGDILLIHRRLDDNWLEGEHHGNAGMFPVSYVEFLPDDFPLGHEGSLESGLNLDGRAKAKYSFKAVTPVELSFHKGDMITLVRRVDANWYEGRIGEKHGILPVNYVETLQEPIAMHDPECHSPVELASRMQAQRRRATSSSPGRPASTAAKKPSEEELFRVLYRYEPRSSDELALTEGDTVRVVEMCDDGWFVGHSARTGLLGTFPGNYVEPL